MLRLESYKVKNVNWFGQGLPSPEMILHLDTPTQMRSQESCPSPVSAVALQKLCKGNLLEEKVPGYQIISFFSGWRPCGLIFDQIHTNKKPDAPGAEGDISESRLEGPQALPYALFSAKSHWKVYHYWRQSHRNWWWCIGSYCNGEGPSISTGKKVVVGGRVCVCVVRAI